MAGSDDRTPGVAPDGSPVAVYLALPVGDEPDVVSTVTPPGGSILELGSGPGRLTQPLLARGYRIVAVDDSTEMLSHIEGAETVLADLYELDLGRTFDTVFGASNLIGVPDVDRRRRLLGVGRRHVTATGAVVLQRYLPEWALDPTPMVRQAGPVGLTFEPIDTGEGWFRGRMIYEVDGASWVQEFTGAHVDEDTLATEAASVGLRFHRWLDDAETWALLRTTESAVTI